MTLCSFGKCYKKKERTIPQKMLLLCCVIAIMNCVGYSKITAERLRQPTPGECPTKSSCVFPLKSQEDAVSLSLVGKKYEKKELGEVQRPHEVIFP